MVLFLLAAKISIIFQLMLQTYQLMDCSNRYINFLKKKYHEQRNKKHQTHGSLGHF